MSLLSPANSVVRQSASARALAVQRACRLVTIASDMNLRHVDGDTHDTRDGLCFRFKSSLAVCYSHNTYGSVAPACWCHYRLFYVWDNVHAGRGKVSVYYKTRARSRTALLDACYGRRVQYLCLKAPNLTTHITSPKYSF